MYLMRTETHNVTSSCRRDLVARVAWAKANTYLSMCEKLLFTDFQNPQEISLLLNLFDLGEEI